MCVLASFHKKITFKRHQVYVINTTSIRGSTDSENVRSWLSSLPFMIKLSRRRSMLPCWSRSVEQTQRWGCSGEGRWCRQPPQIGRLRAGMPEMGVLHQIHSEDTSAHKMTTGWEAVSMQLGITHRHVNQPWAMPVSIVTHSVEGTIFMLNTHISNWYEWWI